MRYLAYGVIIDSDTNLAPYLAPGGDGASGFALRRARIGNLDGLDRQTAVGAIHGRTALARSDRPLERVEPGQPWCIEVMEVVRFHWHVGDESLLYELGPEGSPERLGFWFAHIVLPFCLAMRGDYRFLHAAAVELDDEALVFLAPSGGGKSTITDYFLQHGHALITDDKLATFRRDGRFFGVPSHMGHRPYRANEDLGLRADRIATAARPIREVFTLRLGKPDTALRLSAVRGAPGYGILAQSQIYTFRQDAGDQLAYFAAMAEAVPIYQLELPQEFARLPEVYRTLVTERRGAGDGCG